MLFLFLFLSRCCCRWVVLRCRVPKEEEEEEEAAERGERRRIDSLLEEEEEEEEKRERQRHERVLSPATKRSGTLLFVATTPGGAGVI